MQQTFLISIIIFSLNINLKINLKLPAIVPEKSNGTKKEIQMKKILALLLSSQAIACTSNKPEFTKIIEIQIDGSKVTKVENKSLFGELATQKHVNSNLWMDVRTEFHEMQECRMLVSQAKNVPFTELREPSLLSPSTEEESILVGKKEVVVQTKTDLIEDLKAEKRKTEELSRLLKVISLDKKKCVYEAKIDVKERQNKQVEAGYEALAQAK